MAEYTPSSLNYTVEQRAGGLLVNLIGQLGLPPHTDKLQHELVRIYSMRLPLLVFDLSQLTFVSSLGIGIFADANRTLRRHSGHVKLCGVQPQVMDVFHRTKMTAIFEFLPKSEDAFATA